MFSLSKKHPHPTDEDKAVIGWTFTSPWIIQPINGSINHLEQTRYLIFLSYREYKNLQLYYLPGRKVGGVGGNLIKPSDFINLVNKILFLFGVGKLVKGVFVYSSIDVRA